MSTDAIAAYVFGPFHLDLQAGELRKNGQQLEVRPKVFDLLVYLVQNRGRLLPKEALLEQVWSDVVVSDTSLTRTVADLRELLDDAPEQPKYIQTMPRRGYKFVAAVEEIRSAPARLSGTASGLSLLHGAKEYPLREGTHLIGRGREADIPLFTSSTSRQHARVHVSSEDVILEDLGSMNGTRVNGQRISGSVELKLGDQIEVGGETLVLWSPLSPTEPEA